MKKTYAIITPSYVNDFERCKLLVESKRKFLKEYVVQYIVIDKSDINLFKQLESSQTKLLIKQNILPWWIIKLPFLLKNKTVWLSLKGNLLRGWIIQQMIKLAVSKYVSEDILVYMDSDEFFVKKTSFNDLFVEIEKLRLYRNDGGCDPKWATTVADILSLEVSDCAKYSFVGHPVTWSRLKVLDLLDFIENKYKTDWYTVVSKYWNFSEYQLYGCYMSFCDELNSDYFVTDVEFSHQLYWKDGICPDPLSEKECIDFFDKVGDKNFGMITSASKTPLENYSNILRNLE